MCDPQGQFNREGGGFELATYSNFVRLEDDRARANSLVMTVPLDQIIDLCAFNGDLDKIAGYLCNQDCSNEATEIRDDPPELPTRPIRGGCAQPCQGG